MQGHTVHDAGHRKFAHARLQEAAAHILLGNGTGLFQEAVGFVRVAQVGRSDDHVLDLFGQHAQHSSRSGARSDVFTALDAEVIDRRQFAGKELVEFFGQFAVGSGPTLLLFAAQRHPFTQFGSPLGIEFFHVVENHERIFGIAAQVSHRFGDVGPGSRQRLAVCRNFVLEALALFAECALAHYRMADDQRRFLGFVHGTGQRHANLTAVVAVDADHVPTPRLVFGHDILGRHLVHLRRKLDVVRIVEHDKVVQSEVAGDTAHALGYLLLDAAVGDECESLVRHPFAETLNHETFCDRRAESHRMTLSQRTRSILDSPFQVTLGMTRGRAAPLAEILELVERKIAGQRQHRIEHRRHVARIEEETVAQRIGGIVGIVFQELGIEDVDKVGTAHRSSGMARLRFLYH